MDFGEVLRRAWQIIWKHKILWVFGIFAGCSRGGGGGNSGSRFNTPGNGGQQFQQYGEQFSNWITSHWWVIVLFVIVLLVIIVLAILLSTIGRIGLIKGTQKADAGAEHLGFAELWDQGLPYFWRVFLLALLVGLATFIVAIVIGAAAIAGTVATFGLGLLCLLPFLCLFGLALAAVALVVQLAEIAIVSENLGIMDGLRRGWAVFRANLGPVLIMWLILAVIGFVVGIVIAIPVLVVVVPAAIAFAAANANSTASQVSFAPLIFGLLCCAAYFPVLLVLNGILTAYLQSAWTLTFLRLTAPKATSGIEPAPPESPILTTPNA